MITQPHPGPPCIPGVSISTHACRISLDRLLPLESRAHTCHKNWIKQGVKKGKKEKRKEGNKKEKKRKKEMRKKARKEAINHGRNEEMKKERKKKERELEAWQKPQGLRSSSHGAR
mmetsp:Transcript_48268/g.95269  ORF Transcript_48268/g.95269 Transcript_48268/m.95269 type:complete len:116 (+) Transcript_48268:290-637(+)